LGWDLSVEARVEGMRKLLGIPLDVVPFSLVPFGHPAEERLAHRPLRRGKGYHRERW
jgi:hypothetical protein